MEEEVTQETSNERQTYQLFMFQSTKAKDNSQRNKSVCKRHTVADNKYGLLQSLTRQTVVTTFIPVKLRAHYLMPCSIK